MYVKGLVVVVTRDLSRCHTQLDSQEGQFECIQNYRDRRNFCTLGLISVLFFLKEVGNWVIQKSAFCHAIKSLVHYAISVLLVYTKWHIMMAVCIIIWINRTQNGVTDRFYMQ